MKKIYLILIVFVIAFKAHSQSTCFTYTSTNYGGSTNPWYSVSDDFNNDGKKDFAATNYAAGTFNVYMGIGAGSFTQAPSSPYTVGANCFGITSGDFNNDGNKDIIVTSINYFKLYVGTGAGTFTTGANINFAGSSTSYGVIAGDFNNDGNLDAAFASNTSNLGYVYSGNGAGGFTQFAGSPYSLPGTQWWVEKGDFNGDGNIDLIYAENTPGNVSVLMGTGTGSFTINPPVTGLAGAAQLSVGDVNNDGKLDFVTCGGGGSPSFYTCLGTGTGSFSAPIVTSTGALAAPWGVALADFNLDGNKDVILTGFSSNNCSVFYGNGSGGYTASTNSPFIVPGVNQNLHPSVSDLDGDNKTDAIVAGYGSSNHAVLLNRQLSILGASNVCPGSSVTFTASTSTSYSWSTGASTSTITVTPSVTSTYSVFGFYNGCATTGTKTLTVNPNPVVNIVSSNSVLCVGQTATLTASGALTYMWNTSATTSSIAVSPTISTIYSIVGTDSLGCQDSAGFMQVVAVCTGITNMSNTNNFILSVYPNPSNGEFTVRSDVAWSLTIVNELGIEVKKISLNESNNNKALISGLASGLYFIVGTHDGQTSRQRIVITK